MLSPPETPEFPEGTGRMSVELETGRVRRRLAEQHRGLQESMGAGPVGWILPRFLSASAVGIGVTLVLPGLLGGGLGVVDPASPAFWVKLLGPFVVAGAVTSVVYRAARKQSRLSVDEVVDRVDTDHARFTGPGWMGRTLRQGLRMAAGVGIPVGALLALGSPIHELPAGSRLLAFGGFILATAAWTIPGAFVLRWVTLKSHDRLRGATGTPRID